VAWFLAGPVWYLFPLAHGHILLHPRYWAQPPSQPWSRETGHGAQAQRDLHSPETNGPCTPSAAEAGIRLGATLYMYAAYRRR
jgi:hypothetical protein